ncbi:MAG: hypothetical protein QM811_21315 [Pirellulales bacterium]
MRPLTLCRICFTVCAIAGIGLLGSGAVSETWPHFQLDATLTPDELRDEPTREATLAALKNANESRGVWAVCVVAGGIVAKAAIIGFAACDRLGKVSKKP